MTDRPRHPEAGEDSGTAYEREPTGTPRWVKVVGIILAVVVLLVVVMLLVGGGHDPRHHTSPVDGNAVTVNLSQPGGPGSHAPPAGSHG